MIKYVLYPIVLLLIFTIISCEGKRERASENVVSIEGDEANRTVSFYSYAEIPEYPDAMLEMYSPLGNQNFNTNKIPFEFNIKNYPFAEGGRGFQLKMSINGNDPVGYNMPMFQKELNQGTYRAVAYLVNEEGIALREFGNYVDRDFTVMGSKPFPVSNDPFIIINLPENNQSFEEGEEVIVDYLILDGNPVEDNFEIIIKFNQYEHRTQEVIPLRVDDLPAGDYDLEIRLVRSDDKDMDGVFTSTRKRIRIN
ncbi:hypothetical protein [Anditalea andensis]|uniref:Uncharacterized protein n=1 Tax=Anditalea andensis TaxID=1048983 RepID=A0A074LGX4_9BACT|nr:hypothetical protein [Anditalea andensis]KEO73032.1 hypothetical protein EL17_15585 [Anditalea andensis]